MKLQMQCVTFGTFLLLEIGFGFGFFCSLSRCPRVEFAYQKWIQHENGSVGLVNQTDYFPSTLPNKYAMMEQFCVDEKNGISVRRLCLKNGTWERLDNIICRQHRKLSEDLFNMDRLLNPKISMRTTNPDPFPVMKHVTDMVMTLMGPLEPGEVMSVANIIKVVTKSPANLNASTDIISMYNHLMNQSSEILQLAVLHNTTKNLLQNFERFTNNLEPPQCNVMESQQPIRVLDMKKAAGLLLLIGEEISLFHLNPQCNNHTGVAIYNRKGPRRINCKHHRYWYRLLRPDQNLLDLKQEAGLIAATYMTNELWNALRTSGATYIVFKVYTNNAFFFDDSAPQEKLTPTSNVLSLDVIGVDGNLFEICYR